MRHALRSGPLLGLLLVSACSIGTHDVHTLPVPAAPRHFANWDEVFRSPTHLRVTGFHTGDVWTGPEILIERDNPATPEADRVSRWVPSVAYLVEHPTEGRVLFDTGVRAPESGPCDYGLRPFFWVPCRARAGEGAYAQLTKRQLGSSDLRYVVLSHFHGDHVSGLADLEQGGAVAVLTTNEEWQAVASPGRVTEGYMREQIDGTYAVLLAAVSSAQPMPPLGPSLDLFGDGSVWLFAAAGHTRGQIGALLNTEGGPLLLTFDASHLRANLQHQVPPGSASDRGAAIATLARIAAFTRAYPQARVIYGHEPTQWPDDQATIALAP